MALQDYTGGYKETYVYNIIIDNLFFDFLSAAVKQKKSKIGCR